MENLNGLAGRNMQDDQFKRQLMEAKLKSIYNNSSEASIINFDHQESLQEQQWQQSNSNTQTMNKMFSSTTLYDRNSMPANNQRQHKLQKSVILFESGVTLGDLEQLKITNMKDIKKESQILDEEIGNVDDKVFSSLIQDDNLQKRLSSRMIDPIKLPRQSTKGSYKSDQSQSNQQNDGQNIPKTQVDQVYIQEQLIQKSMIQSRIFLHSEIATIQEQNEELTSEIAEKQQQDQLNQTNKCSSFNSDIDIDIDEEDQVVEDEHCNVNDKIQSIPVMDISEKNIVIYSPNTIQNIKFQIGPLIEIKGYLRKRSPQYIVGWQKRWCVLKDQKLFYYKNEKSYRQYGVICFNIISCRAELIEGKKSKTKKLLLSFPNHNKTFTFKSSDPNKPIQFWYNQVVNHIVQSKGYKQNLILECKKFWKDDRLSVKDFQMQADTGDLILFRGKAIEARLQRAFTSSEFDHVAFVLKYSTSDIFIMEALGGKIGKVILFRWNLFSKNKWYDFYDKIVYRKLSMNRTNSALTNLEKFIQYALNKKYKFTLGKIMRKKTSAKEESDSNEERTFFCSELVAACYKKLGILQEQTASSSYLPGHFSLEKDLKLKNNAQLMHEQVIDFSMD